jgi:hypothetical protein
MVRMLEDIMGLQNNLILMKKYIPSISITIICILSQVMNYVYRGKYSEYFSYIFLIVIILIAILSLPKQIREEKLNGTLFKHSIYRMLVIAVIILLYYFVTKNDCI